MNGPCLSLSHTLKHIFSATAPQCESLLYRCATTAKSLATTKKLHAHTITSGILSNHFLSLLTSAYGLCGQMEYACRLFDELPKRTPVACKAIIRMYTENGYPRSALELFVEMRGSCCYWADDYTYPLFVRACGDSLLLELGMVIHGLIVKSGFVSGIFVGNSLLAMYMTCGDKDGARRVFDAMKDKSVVSWNTMISGYFRNGSAKEALMVFRRMVNSEVEFDSATVLSVLPACGYLKDLEVGREVHLLIKDKSFWKRLAVQNALLDMYVKCGRMDEARGVFDGMVEKDVVTWTTVIHGYILYADVKGALELCRLMQFEGVRPNEVTLASLLAMCADLQDLKLGKCLHGWAIRQYIESDVNMETALIDLYAKCSSFRLSLKVFSRTSKKRTVPWNAILSGCIHNNLAREAIQLFKQMLLEAVKLNDATWKSLLPAYAIEADLHQAMNIHSYLMRSGFVRKPDIVTGLMDVYSKCGTLQYAHNLFDTLSARNRDIVSWSVIIAGYGKHGHGKVALSLFNQMVQSGVKPNEVTFTSALHACGHAGLVDDGLNLFNFMQKNHPENLRTDHYTCIVDLLGRADRLEEAYHLINIMPFEPSHAVWGALLGACAIHENVELGEVAAKWLFKLEPENTGNYILLGNIYSAVGRFDDAEKVRQMMDDIGLVKAPANSMIEVRNL
ncbi:UNVERIFIED_CONTAM: Pentatricopeptide repeat-containing protein [Sesamum latifolium]|uniref:Pentatricopeptide repeat-containing protein n=1 Tax=Sesamum latifolium TaxID=2727402 RepID=A0AAW2X9J0_9LAMI